VSFACGDAGNAKECLSTVLFSVILSSVIIILTTVKARERRVVIVSMEKENLKKIKYHEQSNIFTINSCSSICCQ